LARECGFKIEMEDISSQALLSDEAMSAASVDDFFEVLKKENAHYENLLLEAHKNQKVLRFIARFENEKASIGLEAIGVDHPFYSLSGSENIVSFTTARYNPNPLVVKGPGAGAEVTAQGVFGDLISLCSFLS
jgi:aspartokinase/homoserine dehydrogenase 1